MSESEAPRQLPENFNGILARLNELGRDTSQREEYLALLDTYEKAENGKLPDDLDFALWSPFDFGDLRSRHQQIMQGESL